MGLQHNHRMSSAAAHIMLVSSGRVSKLSPPRIWAAPSKDPFTHSVMRAALLGHSWGLESTTSRHLRRLRTSQSTLLPRCDKLQLVFWVPQCNLPISYVRRLQEACISAATMIDAYSDGRLRYTGDPLRCRWFPIYWSCGCSTHVRLSMCGR